MKATFILGSWKFCRHETVKHTADEYVRGDVTTNTVESYFSVFKRGMRGTYQHCSEKHLHRYLAEFDFRYNNRVALGVKTQARRDFGGWHRRQAPDLSTASRSLILAAPHVFCAGESAIKSLVSPVFSGLSFWDSFFFWL